MIDITKEITFKTARSGGSGGQNVNKVETAVTGYLVIYESALLSEAQKAVLYKKLAPHLNNDGALMVKSQQERTQFGNKAIVIKKMNLLINKALVPVKKRVKTNVPKSAVEDRIQEKKQQGERKKSRQKNKWDDIS